MTLETKTITIAQTTKTPDRRVVSVVEAEPVQETAFTIMDIAERFRNPNDAQIVWDKLFQHMTRAEFAENKGQYSREEHETRMQKIADYPLTIAGRFGAFYSAMSELEALREDPARILEADEVMACVIHPDRRVAEKVGRVIAIKDPILLTILVTRLDINEQQVAKIMKRQEEMMLPKDVVKKMLEIQDEMAELNFKPTPDYEYDYDAVAQWLKSLQSSPANSSKLAL